jgi:hypothetical protein
LIESPGDAFEWQVLGKVLAVGAAADDIGSAGVASGAAAAFATIKPPAPAIPHASANVGQSSLAQP